jgi:hypothetical protein
MQTPTSEWYEIDSVLKRRRQKKGDEFLVKWKDSDQTDWVKSENVSPATLQEFLQRHHRRRKRRARNLPTAEVITAQIIYFLDTFIHI